MLTEAQLKLLDEIAPWWAKRIRKGNLKSTRTWALYDPDKCVAGEAHKSKKKPQPERYWFAPGNAYCNTCRKNGDNMECAARRADTWTYERTPRFDTQVKRFLTHFVKVHKSAVTVPT